MHTQAQWAYVNRYLSQRVFKWHWTKNRLNDRLWLQFLCCRCSWSRFPCENISVEPLRSCCFESNLPSLFKYKQFSITINLSISPAWNYFVLESHRYIEKWNWHWSQLQCCDVNVCKLHLSSFNFCIRATREKKKQSFYFYGMIFHWTQVP